MSSTTSSGPPGPPTGDPSATINEEPSHYPRPTVNEFRYQYYRDNNQNDKADKIDVHDAFKYWADMMQAGVNALADSNDNTYSRWFPAMAGGMNGRQYVYNVLIRLLDDDEDDPTPHPRVVSLVSRRDDFQGRCSGNTLAYFGVTSGYFHICQEAFRLPIQAGDVDCDTLGSRVSKKMDSVTSTEVHEFFHWYQVGDSVENSLGWLPCVQNCLGDANDSSRAYRRSCSWRTEVLRGAE